MTALYTLTDELLHLYEQIEDAEGEVSPELERMLDEASGSFEAKAGGYLARIRQWRAEADMIRAEEQRLADMRKTRERKEERLRSRLLECMRALGRMSVDTGVMGTARILPPRTSVHVEDVDALPEEYRRVTVAADKRAIGKALEAGETVPGAELREGEPGLVIR